MKNVDVAIEKCFSYEFNEVFSTISKCCDNTAFPEVKGKTVLVKPNILSDSEVENCITTNPEVVRATIRLLKDKGAKKVIVGDSPGLHQTSFKGKKCGIYDVCQDEDVEFVDFTNKASYQRLFGSGAKVLITDYAFDSDIIISVSKFKTHMLMGATGAVKNLFGTIPGLNKSTCHLSYPTKKSFASFLIDLHETIKPDFAIMDAVIGMEGPGPANGIPRAINLILASESCFSLDYAEALIMGYVPKELPILYEGSKRGLIPETINYPLLKPIDLVISDFKRIPIENKTKFFSNLVLPFFKSKLLKKNKEKEPAPFFDQSKCILCQRCVKICPAKALTVTENKISIDYTQCIRCYCCHEMCPKDAITIKEIK